MFPMPSTLMSTSTLFHSPDISELMGEEPALELSELLSEAGLSAEEVATLPPGETLARLRAIGVTLGPEQLQPLLVALPGQRG